MTIADAYERTSRVMVENMLAADAKEGISAFFEKREPNWSTNQVAKAMNSREP